MTSHLSQAKADSPQRKLEISARDNRQKQRQKLRQHSFVGICLGGGKTARTSVAVVDYFPQHKKVFLSRIIDRVGSEGDNSADRQLLKVIADLDKRPEWIALDVPLQLPKCLRCRLKCPGYERCKVPEIQWLRRSHARYRAKKRPHKMFTPYTQRCVEQFIAHELEETFHPQHALGANSAPLTARAQYLLKHLKPATLEVIPEVALWRIGKALGMSRLHLRHHRHSIEGEKSRHYILQNLVANQVVFIYEQDLQVLASNGCAFDAFIAAFTAYLNFVQKCEARPKGYPRAASWVAIPLRQWPSAKRK